MQLSAPSMLHRSRSTAVVLGLAIFLSGCASPAADNTARTSATATSNSGSFRDCQPGQPCTTPFAVKVVIVTMFEIGADEGDTAGEFQLWKERQQLTQRIAFPHGHHDLFLNPSTGVLAIVTGVGTMNSAATMMALGLDQRFDLSHAYWLVAGIAGIDPEDASIGSAAWSTWLVDGDLGHEIDPREIPQDWDYGFFARRTQFPFDPKRPESRGEVFKTNGRLRDWAFELTKDVDLGDSASLQESRQHYVNHPNALRPPFVLKGGHIAAMTFWHGRLMNDWANKWVSYWSGGETDFVTSAMEETGSYRAIAYLHNIQRVDKNRFMVLRSGSNFTMPPPGVGAAENLLRENKGYQGLQVAVESLYRVGVKVVDELLSDWPKYKNSIPGTTTVPGADQASTIE